MIRPGESRRGGGGFGSAIERSATRGPDCRRQFGSSCTPLAPSPPHQSFLFLTVQLSRSELLLVFCNATMTVVLIDYVCTSWLDPSAGPHQQS